MRSRVWIAALAAGVSMGALLLAQGFNIRTGMWQFTITMKGAMGLEGLPPEVQAQIAAQMSKPQTTTSCVSAEDLKAFRLGRMDDNADDEDCKLLSSKFTATTADITRECTGDDAYTETAHFEASSPQALTGNISRKTAKGPMNITMAGKWVAAACKE
jgi:hypothetical protein